MLSPRTLSVSDALGFAGAAAASQQAPRTLVAELSMVGNPSLHAPLSARLQAAFKAQAAAGALWEGKDLKTEYADRHRVRAIYSQVRSATNRENRGGGALDSRLRQAMNQVAQSSHAVVHSESNVNFWQDFAIARKNERLAKQLNKIETSYEKGKHFDQMQGKLERIIKDAFDDDPEQKQRLLALLGETAHVVHSVSTQLQDWKSRRGDTEALLATIESGYSSTCGHKIQWDIPKVTSEQAHCARIQKANSCKKLMAQKSQLPRLAISPAGTERATPVANAAPQDVEEHLELLDDGTCHGMAVGSSSHQNKELETLLFDAAGHLANLRQNIKLACSGCEAFVNAGVGAHASGRAVCGSPDGGVVPISCFEERTASKGRKLERANAQNLDKFQIDELVAVAFEQVLVDRVLEQLRSQVLREGHSAGLADSDSDEAGAALDVRPEDVEEDPYGPLPCGNSTMPEAASVSQLPPLSPGTVWPPAGWARLGAKQPRQTPYSEAPQTAQEFVPMTQLETEEARRWRKVVEAGSGIEAVMVERQQRACRCCTLSSQSGWMRGGPPADSRVPGARARPSRWTSRPMMRQRRARTARLRL